MYIFTSASVLVGDTHVIFSDHFYVSWDTLMRFLPYEQKEHSWERSYSSVAFGNNGNERTVSYNTAQSEMVRCIPLRLLALMFGRRDMRQEPYLFIHYLLQQTTLTSNCNQLPYFNYLLFFNVVLCYFVWYY